MRRDRHGRGMRGPLAPNDVPVSLTRAEQFDELVLDAVEEIERGLELRDEDDLRRQLAVIELGVEDIPMVPANASDGEREANDEPADRRPVPLARCEPAVGERPARVIVYRRPAELRASGEDREELVREIVADQLAELLGVPVERLDPLD